MRRRPLFSLINPFFERETPPFKKNFLSLSQKISSWCFTIFSADYDTDIFARLSGGLKRQGEGERRET